MPASRSRPRLCDPRNRGRACRRAISLVEVLVATAILAGLLVPVITGFDTSTKKLRYEQMENAAAAFAQKVFEQLVFGRPFDNVKNVTDVDVGPAGITLFSGGSAVPGGPRPENASELDGIEGVTFRIDMRVADIIADDLSTNFTVIPFHAPEAAGTESVYTSKPGQDVQQELENIDREYQGKVVLKDVMLILSWKGPADKGFPTREDAGRGGRRAVLLTRRARLEEGT